MDRWLDRTALGLAVTGWLCSIFTRCLSLWKVSGTVDNVTATLPAYWDGVWLDWDHWDLAHDGSLHCSFYQRLMSLSGNFRTWRALVGAAIGAGAFAVAVGTAGIVWFPTRGQPLDGAKDLQRDWGPALYLGWISFALMVAGGAFLLTRCPRSQEPVGSVPVSRYPQQEESENPLSTIHRTTFTNSQYNRAHSEPI
ncbi:unnamed protein product [Arctogadus glacialis]